MRLSRHQAAVLAFIRSELAAGRPFPRNSVIVAACGLSSISQAGDILVTLAGRGYVQLLGRKPRGGGFENVWGLVEA